MIRTIKNVTGALVVLFLMSGCQAMTGETMGQNLDDGALTSSVKTKLASDKLVTLSRVGVETNNGIVFVAGERRQKGGQQFASHPALVADGSNARAFDRRRNL